MLKSADVQRCGQVTCEVMARVLRMMPDMVHKSVTSDPLLALRHRNFQITHITSAVLATAVLLIFFNIYDARALPSSLFFFWFSSPLIIVLYLSRTGRIDIAQFLSSINLSGLAGVAAFYTGGINSPLILWMLIVPLEAALSRRRIMTYLGVVVSCLVLAALYYATMGGILPQPLVPIINAEAFALISTIAAVAYAGGIASTVQRMNRISSSALQASRENYRFLADNATDLITRHRADGTVIFASQAAAQIIGVEPEVLEKDGLLEWIHEADRKAYLRAIASSAQKMITVSEELRVRKLDDNGGGEPRSDHVWMEMRCRPVSDVPNSFRRCAAGREVLAVTRDISLRKAQELELERAKEHAESANRAKSLFVASISHELRTPLNAIVGFSDILSTELEKADVEEKLIEYLGIIQDGGQHLSKIVNDILDLSKIEAGKFEIVPEPCDLDELISLSCSTLKAQAGTRNISIDYRAGKWDGDVVCDVRAVKQVLLNLLSNAVKFSREDGVVKVRLMEAGSNVRIEVIDQGVGIAAEDIGKLGKPFVQAKNTYSRKTEGTGLGLCVVSGLVGLHGGRLDIESELGVGTTMIVELPIAGPDSSGDAVREIIADDAVAARRRVVDEPCAELQTAKCG